MIGSEGYRLQIDESGIRAVISSPQGIVVQAVSRAGTAVVGHARADLIRKRIGNTGKLAQQIDSTVTVEGDSVVSRVVSRARSEDGAAYGIFVHEGTKSPIVPRRARALRFKPKGSSVFIFRGKVRGTRETGRFTPFLRNGLEQLRVSDFS